MKFASFPCLCVVQSLGKGPCRVLQHKELVLGVIFGVFHGLQSPVFVLDHGVCFMLCVVKVKVEVALV